ncbi:MAG: hypothetical protein ACKVOM_03980 [Ferruginibacter sp.]
MVGCATMQGEGPTEVKETKIMRWLTIYKKIHLQILQMEYLKGYETKAGTMFVAVLSS